MDWTKPTPVTDLDLAFPANALELMPPMEECEAALEDMPDHGGKWLGLQTHWFRQGLPETVEFLLKPGVDGEEAIRHLRVVQESYAAKHQHKQAAFAYLASLWFDDFSYEGFDIEVEESDGGD